MKTPMLDERALAFLHESNAIEEITNIDYRISENARLGAGHVGAFIDSQDKASRREPLTVADICRWQRWLTEEQVRFGHSIPMNGIGVLRNPENRYDVRVGPHIAPSFVQVPHLVEEWLADLNGRLASFGYIPSISEFSDVLSRLERGGNDQPVPVLGDFPSDVDVVDVLGEYFQRFEAIHPFVDGNGRTGRLIANYIASYCERPLIIFRAEERPAFYAAHRSKMAMRIFMSGKIRETFQRMDGSVLERQKELGGADEYEGCIVERHELLAARKRWSDALSEEDRRRGSNLSPIDERIVEE